MKYYLFTTSKEGKTLLYEYEDDIAFFKAVEQVMIQKLFCFAIKGTKILDLFANNFEHLEIKESM